MKKLIPKYQDGDLIHTAKPSQYDFQVTAEAPTVYWDGFNWIGFNDLGQRVPKGPNFNPSGARVIENPQEFENARLAQARRKDVNGTHRFAEKVRGVATLASMAPMAGPLVEAATTVAPTVTPWIKGAMELGVRPTSTIVRGLSSYVPQVSKTIPYFIGLDKTAMGMAGLFGMKDAYEGYKSGDKHWANALAEGALSGMMAAELAPAIKYANELAGRGFNFLNSPLTGKWTTFGNKQYRFKPGYLGMNGTSVESRKTKDYSSFLDTDLNKMRGIFEDYEKGLTQYKGSKLPSSLEYNYETPKIDFDNLVKDDFVDYLSQQTGKTIKRIPIKDTKHGDIYNEGFAFVDDGGKEIAYIAGDREAGKNVWVGSSFVTPEFRHQGLGKQMYFDFNDHVFNTYGTTLHSSPYQRVGFTGAGESPSNRLWKSLRENGLSSFEGEGLNRYDVMAEPSKITTAYRTPATPQITSENAASITPEQWTAAQDAAIARGDMAEAQRLRDLHFMAKTPNNKITSKLYHGTDATWTEYNPGFFSSGSGDQGVFGKGLYLSQYPEVSKRYGKNMMELYAYSKNPYTADRGFELFDDAAHAFNRYENSEKLFPVLKGKDAVTSPRMVMEDGWKFHYEPNEEVVIPRGEQIKSADAVTYDNKGVRIPLGKRDNFNVNDIRYGLLPWLIGGTTAGYLYNNKKASNSQ